LVLISFQSVQKKSGGQKICTAPWRDVPDQELLVELEHRLISGDTSGTTSEKDV
jgi:hypothetical protein